MHSTTSCPSTGPHLRPWPGNALLPEAPALCRSEAPSSGRRLASSSKPAEDKADREHNLPELRSTFQHQPRAAVGRHHRHRPSHRPISALDHSPIPTVANEEVALGTVIHHRCADWKAILHDSSASSALQDAHGHWEATFLSLPEEVWIGGRIPRTSPGWLHQGPGRPSTHPLQALLHVVAPAQCLMQRHALRSAAIIAVGPAQAPLGHRCSGPPAPSPLSPMWRSL